MTKTAHSPGPWRIQCYSNMHIIQENFPGTTKKQNKIICKIRNLRDSGFGDNYNVERDANARLIVEAPAMKDALHEAMDIIEFQLSQEVTPITDRQQRFIEQAAAIIYRIENPDE